MDPSKTSIRAVEVFKKHFGKSYGTFISGNVLIAMAKSFVAAMDMTSATESDKVEIYDIILRQL